MSSAELYVQRCKELRARVTRGISYSDYLQKVIGLTAGLAMIDRPPDDRCSSFFESAKHTLGEYAGAASWWREKVNRQADGTAALTPEEAFQADLLAATFLGDTSINKFESLKVAQSSPAASDNRQTAAPQQAPGKQGGTSDHGMLVVKGLSLAMSEDEIRAMLRKRFRAEPEVKEVTDHPGAKLLDLEEQGIAAEIDPGGKVAAIVLSGRAVDSLFNSADMTPEEFAKEFIHTYGIPRMETAFEEKMGGDAIRSYHEYKSPDGYKVTIEIETKVFRDLSDDPLGQLLAARASDPKRLAIIATRAASDRKFGD